MKKYILSLDQGTTSSRAILFDQSGHIVGVENKEFKQIYPKPGWVEHNPNDLWQSQLEVIQSVLKNNVISSDDIAAIGITNQRETSIIWDKNTGEPIYNAIVWQDRRTAQLANQLKKAGHSSMIQEKTGLIPDAYFSGTKIKWILDNVAGARDKAEAGELLFGTVDTWLIYNLTGGQKHVTDITNASRTMLYNIVDCDWDAELLELLNVPSSLLPEVCSCSEIIADTSTELFGTPIPISGIAGDQQAALFGQLCVREGMAKNTYGTGSFIVVNTGSNVVKSENNLLSTIAWKLDGKVSYALEGSIFIAGAIIQWLRDELQIIKNAPEVNDLAAEVEDTGDVYLVPALSGLGAPHWDGFARGTIVGLTRGSNKCHIARAALESIAFQTLDVLDAMKNDFGGSLKELRVDGGASASEILMQFQADITGLEVDRPKIMETTALGAAYFAGLAVGFWKSIDELETQRNSDKKFIPAEMDREKRHKRWRQAVELSKGWANENEA
jgi:glycerol kinase